MASTETTGAKAVSPITVSFETPSVNHLMSSNSLVYVREKNQNLLLFRNLVLQQHYAVARVRQRGRDVTLSLLQLDDGAFEIQARCIFAVVWPASL